MIKFVEINPETIFSDIVNTVQTELDEELHEGDERKLFIKSLMPIFVGIANKINDTANQNLLENARDEKLDAIATDYHSTSRLQSTYSFCKGKAKLSAIQKQDIPIKAGTKVTPDGIVMFKVREDAVIPKGSLECDLVLIAASTGTKYNGFDPGKINYIVDPIPFVSEIVNTEISKSGSDIEDDKSYRERARLAMESKSTAGPDGAYEYFAYSADNSISGVKITSPSPGVVKIFVVVDGGEIPSQEILDKVYNKCSPRDVRPLTDKVETGSPTVSSYNIELTYYLDKNFPTNEGKWRKAIEGENLDFADGAIREFIKWQQSEIGKSVNPDELKYQIQDVAAYEVDNRKISGVRRIELTSPIHKTIGENEIAKVGSITVTYGGME
ncbi:baseplate J/gp47 family protein [Clostridium beijerinckii]|uniref:Phage-related baseplate assembly protein n=1 Tax=Clostridium beijerinckii TaxID=1520 RepID=A0AAX0B4N6_CLOBE|nr:baseplate J/gp47 family protein [Clostridium beijerinckii]NRT90086.1 phage-related baseplate assembly protein [Clostridium beijerinckii]NYC69616.1 phage-related baseplate assembly protein [Clostridium beijerinckii]